MSSTHSRMAPTRLHDRRGEASVGRTTVPRKMAGHAGADCGQAAVWRRHGVVSASSGVGRARLGQSSMLQSALSTLRGRPDPSPGRSTPASNLPLKPGGGDREQTSYQEERPEMSDDSSISHFFLQHLPTFANWQGASEDFEMPSAFGTPSVALATTPTVVSTFFTHLLHSRKRSKQARKSLKEGGPGAGPEDQLTYEEGLKVVRRFIDFASHHGVEEVQGFTAMPIPTPYWVKRDVVSIPDATITKAADILKQHLGSYGPDGANGGGLKLVGGSRWWQVRGRNLEGEWIEMQKDYLRRTATSSSASSLPEGNASSSTTPVTPTSTAWSYLPRRAATLGSVRDNTGHAVVGERVILYIHGGAYFFSSLDTHRYQVSRHVRKAGARAFCVAYRLAPQYPFPCGLLDALAAYLYLIDPPEGAHRPILPTSIVVMGDSAGAGMALSLLVLIREMGLPMPAGASLISPWVDLTHSCPSIGGDASGDFIPGYGFHYKPSVAWPPLPGDGVTVKMPHGADEHFDEQIQMYCPNNLMTHPLVSPINQGSLGGLCPLLILGGGGELLRDEIIYIAHKAADPTAYPPASATLAEYPDQAALVAKYPPTKVHLQIYEGCCHVVPTLSWSKSAKYMYRACANFNIWAFTAAAKAVEAKTRRGKHGQKVNQSSQSTWVSTSSKATTNGFGSHSAPMTMTSSPTTSAAPSRVPSILDLTQPIIDSRAAQAANAEPVPEHDVESEASSSTDDEGDDRETSAAKDAGPSTGIVTVNGAEPPFGAGSIVSERVSTQGKIRPFEPIEAIPALQPELREHIGRIHGDGALLRWTARRAEWDTKYASALEKWREVRRRDRAKAEVEGYLTRDLQDERPPLCSLAGWYDRELAREVGRNVDEISGKKAGGAMMLWMKMSSKADREHAGGESVGDIKEGVEQEVRVERARRLSSTGGGGPAAPAPMTMPGLPSAAEGHLRAANGPDVEQVAVKQGDLPPGAATVQVAPEAREKRLDGDPAWGA